MRVMIEEVRSSIARDDLGTAINRAEQLDDEIQKQYKAWLLRDVAQRIDEVLTWLPPDTESFWVCQSPAEIDTSESSSQLIADPLRGFAVNGLRAVAAEKYYRALNHRTIRFVAAAARGIRGGRQGTPGPVAADDVVYFYFFDSPIELPAIDGDAWIALVRPDVLVVANNEAQLKQTIQRISDGNRIRALPTNLPEWRHVDKRASLWGLRHYSQQSRPEPGQPGYEQAKFPKPDGLAVGLTVGFDAIEQRLVVEYMSPNNYALPITLEHEFKLDSPQNGVWRLISNIRERRHFPVHMAMSMLGFGVDP